MSLRAPGILVAFAVAMLLRVGLVVVLPDPTPVNDEVDYWRLAEGIARGEGFLSSFRPPLHPAFLSLFVGWGDGATAVRFSQALIGGLTVFPLAWLAWRAAGATAAQVAAWVFALDPVLIGFSHLLWSETIYIALLLCGLVALVFDAERPRVGCWAGAGLCFGLAGLARPQLLSFLPLLLPWAVWFSRGQASATKRQTGLAFAALTLATCAVVLPWSLRNLERSGDFYLVDTNGPYNLLVSTEPGAHHVDKDDRWDPSWAAVGNSHYMFVADREPAAAQSYALRQATRRIGEAPARFLSKSLWEAGHLFTLDNFILRHLRNDWYGAPASRPLVIGLTAWSVAWTLVLYLVGGSGLVLMPATPLRGLAALAIVHALVIFGLTYSLSRYAVPLRPLLMLGVAGFAVHGRLAFSKLSGEPVRAGLCALIAIWLAIAWARDLPLLVDMMSTGGDGFRFVRSIGP